LAEELKEKFPRALVLPETPYRDLPRVLTAADVLVLPNSAKDEDASLYTSPLKAFAYMATGKPIIASDVPALKNILGENAIFFIADDTRALAQALGVPKGTLQAPLRYTWQERVWTILSAVKNNV